MHLLVEYLMSVEEELQQAQQKLHTVLSNVSDGLAILDRDWRCTFFSEQAERLVGVSSEAVLGKCIWDIFPRAEGTEFPEGYRRAIETGQPVQFEEFFPDPLNLWLECHCYPTVDGLAVYFHDITERKQAEKERNRIASKLEQQYRVFDTVLSAITDFAYIFDLEGRFLYANKALLDLWGLSL